MHSQLLRWVYRELKLYHERWSLRSELRYSLDRIKMNPSFRTSFTAAFQAAARIRSLYVELRVLAAEVRMNFLHSLLWRWVYRELKFTIKGGVYDLRAAARSR